MIWADGRIYIYSGRKDTFQMKKISSNLTLSYMEILQILSLEIWTL